jgi:alkylresorcinol/alkylpyrone synthase
VVGGSGVITAVATAYPQAIAQADLWDGFFAAHIGGRRAARAAFFATGVDVRHAVVNPLDEDVSGWSTGRRMDRYEIEAMPLGKEALGEALASSGVSAAEVGCFVFVSCTGYATPGIDVRLARDLGMSADVKRFVLGHVGCHAALPGLDVARQYVETEGRPAVLLCLELPSLHLQPSSTELADVVVHALFSDGAAAVVIEPATAGRGLEVVDVASMTEVATEEYMTWRVTDLGFKMTLSRHVPDALAATVAPMVDTLLVRHGLERASIDAWAVHPGGPRILDVVGERLCLPDDSLDCAREVLARHGNCSSVTVLAVLDAVVASRTVRSGGYVVMLAFGPGLTLSAALLRSDG